MRNPKDNRPQPLCRGSGARFWASLALAFVCTLGFFSACTALASETKTSERPFVAAASSLRLAWPDLMSAWSEAPAKVSFAASGTLAQQIRNGAPFELFLSADDASIEAIVNAGLAHQAPEPYALGSLVLVFQREAGSDNSVQDLADHLDRLLVTDNDRLALANPEHAPYGQAAREVLQSIQRESQTIEHWVIGENAAQALHFVQIGAARAGLIPTSLASVIDKERFAIVPIDPDLHENIVHYMVLLQDASTSATRLHSWLLSDPARQTLESFGLTVTR